MEAAGFSMNFETPAPKRCHVSFIGLVQGKIYRKPWFSPSNIWFSCIFSLQLIHWQLKLKMKTWSMNFLWLWPTQWHKSQRYRMLNPVTRVLAALGDHKIAAWLLLKNVRGDDNSMSYTNVRGDDDSIQCGAHEVLIWFIPRLTSSIYIFIYLLYLA